MTVNTKLKQSKKHPTPSRSQITRKHNLEVWNFASWARNMKALYRTKAPVNLCKMLENITDKGFHVSDMEYLFRADRQVGHARDQQIGTFQVW